MDSIRSLQDLLRNSADEHGELPALLAPGRPKLTYAALWDHVENTISRITSFGIRHSDCVAIVLPNGPEMVTTFFSVASHCTAAPLNPGYRQSEFEFYLSDLNAKRLIVLAGDEGPAVAAAARLNVPTIEISVSPRQAAGIFTMLGCEAESDPPSLPGAEETALVLHTSGTTSRPKIVPLTHGNLCASAFNVRRTLQLSPRDRCLNIMPLFHIHGLVAALLGSVSAGASLVATPGFVATEFFAWMSEFQPSWYTAVPTMHQAILARAASHRDVIRDNPLRLIRSSSSSLPPTVLAQLEATFNAPVVEAYGMTEAAHQMACNPLPPDRRVPGSVGPAAGPEMGVMDDDDNLLPAGTIGEVVIRGENVTPGYKNNPQANQAAFSRGWFRTGDQGCLDDEGYLRLTGRLKEIINRGGEKISPREIDEAFLEHSAVAQAVAFAIPDPQLGEEIAIAIVLAEGETATRDDLLAYVARRLVDFKLPRKVLLLDEIPKGPTGKPQRIGLAEKLGLDKETDVIASDPVAYVAPRNQLEETLVKLVSEVLHSKAPVGINDDFFAIGGDSILATQLLARTYDALHIEIPIFRLFEQPTVSQLAEFVRRSEPKSELKPVASAPAVAGGERMPLTPSQRAIWVSEQLSRDAPINHCVWSIQIHGPLQRDVLKQSLDALGLRHQPLRTIFPYVDGQIMSQVSEHVSLDLPEADLSQLSSSDQTSTMRQIAAGQSAVPFDLESGPTWRAQLIHLTRERHVLLLTIHHIVFDGWSVSVLVQDLAAAYDSLAAARPEPAPLQYNYTDYVRFQQERLQGEDFERSLEYWTGHLAGFQRLELPLVHASLPASHAPRGRGGLQTAVIDAVTKERLASLAREERSTLFMIMAAAFNVFLHAVTGATDIVFGSFVSGRERVEFESLVGSFANATVMRTDASGNPTFRQLLRRVRRTAIDAVSHCHVPIVSLTRELRINSVLGQRPFFDIVFQMRNLPRLHAEAADVRFEAIQADDQIAHYRLMVEVLDLQPGLLTRFEYDKDCFTEDTIQRWRDSWQRLIQSLVDAPDENLSQHARPIQPLVTQHGTANPRQSTKSGPLMNNPARQRA